MTKDEFLHRLNQALSSMKPVERARTVQYYREILEDRMEEGASEAEAVADLDPEAIAADLLASGTAPVRPRRSRFGTAMLVLGSPVWLPLLLAAGIVALALYIVVWALVVSMFAVVLALAVCLPAGILALVIYLGSHFWTGLFLLGAGLVCGALAVALFLPCLAAARLLVRASGQLLRRFWDRVFHGKELAE